MDEMSLTIFIPTYGENSWLMETLLSINLPKAVVVMEDGPTNPVNLQICRMFDVKYITNEINIGIAGNFNRCINYCKTKYMMIIGPDDLIEGDIHQLEVFLSKNHKKEIYLMNHEVIDKNGNSVKILRDRVKKLIKPNVNSNKKKIVMSLMIGNWTCSPAIVWPCDNSISYNPKFKIANDLARLLDYLLNDYEIRDLNLDLTLKYRRHPSSVSQQALINKTLRQDEMRLHRHYRKNFLQKRYWLAYLATYVQLTSRLDYYRQTLGRLGKKIGKH